MEQIPLDMQLEVLENLSPKDVISLCQTSSNMRKICGDPRFNRYWFNRLQLDFNYSYNGPNGHEEYKRLYHLYNDSFATVIKQDPEFSLEYGREEYLFLTWLDAEEYVINKALEEGNDSSVPRLRAKINQEGRIIIGEWEYIVGEASFVNNKNRPVSRYKKSVEKYLNYLGINKNSKKIGEYIINTIDEMAEEMVQDNLDFPNKDNLDFPNKDNVDESVGNICSYFGITDEKCNGIRDLINESFIK